MRALLLLDVLITAFYGVVLFYLPRFLFDDAVSPQPPVDL